MKRSIEDGTISDRKKDYCELLAKIGNKAVSKVEEDVNKDYWDGTSYEEFDYDSSLIYKTMENESEISKDFILLWRLIQRFIETDNETFEKECKDEFDKNGIYKRLDKDSENELYVVLTREIKKQMDDMPYREDAELFERILSKNDEKSQDSETSVKDSNKEDKSEIDRDKDKSFPGQEEDKVLLKIREKEEKEKAKTLEKERKSLVNHFKSYKNEIIDRIVESGFTNVEELFKVLDEHKDNR